MENKTRNHYVYVRQENGRIIGVNVLDCEILSPGWTLVYQGEDAPPDLFPKGYLSEKGGFCYALVDGQIVERAAADIEADERAANPIQTAQTPTVDYSELEAAYMEGVQNA